MSTVVVATTVRKKVFNDAPFPLSSCNITYAQHFASQPEDVSLDSWQAATALTSPFP